MVTEAEIKAAIANINGARIDDDEIPEVKAFYDYRDAHKHSSEHALFLEAHTGFSGIAGYYKFSSDPDLSHINRAKLEQQAIEINTARYDAISSAKDELLKGADLTEMTDFLDAAFSRERHLLTPIIDKLEEWNPQLKEGLHYDKNDNKQLYDVILGVLSGFNMDDINYYINKHDPANSTLKIEERAGEGYLPALKKINPEVGVNLERKRKLSEELVKRGLGFKGVIWWIASPSTLNNIEQQLAQLPKIWVADAQRNRSGPHL